MPVESIVRDHQEEYYKALEDATNLGESTPFIKFMLEMILKSIDRVGSEVGNLTVHKVLIAEMLN